MVENKPEETSIEHDGVAERKAEESKAKADEPKAKADNEKAKAEKANKPKSKAPEPPAQDAAEDDNDQNNQDPEHYTETDQDAADRAVLNDDYEADTDLPSDTKRAPTPLRQAHAPRAGFGELPPRTADADAAADATAAARTAGWRW